MNIPTNFAVTDGLTEMFNHRYFQEQMTNNIGNAKRYNSVFSFDYG